MNLLWKLLEGCYLTYDGQEKVTCILKVELRNTIWLKLPAKLTGHVIVIFS